MDYTIVYFYNVYGDNEIGSGKYATVVAKFLNMVKQGKVSLPVTFPGTQLRNFTHIDDIIDGKHLHYPLHKFKNKLFNSGYIPKICSSCGFSEERITDGKMPLLIDFLDGNLNNRKLDNIRALCYNCFFLLVGERNVKNWYAENGGQITEDEEKNIQEQSSIQD